MIKFIGAKVKEKSVSVIIGKSSKKMQIGMTFWCEPSNKFKSRAVLCGMLYINGNKLIEWF